MLIFIDCWSAVPSLLPGHLAQLPAGLLRSGRHRRGRLLAGLQTQRFSLFYIFPQQYILGIRELTYIFFSFWLTNIHSALLCCCGQRWAGVCCGHRQLSVGSMCLKIFVWNDWFIRIKIKLALFRIKILSSELEFIAHIDAEVRKKQAKYRRLHKI